VVAQHAVTLVLLCWPIDISEWISFDDAAPNGPREQSVQIGVQPAGSDRRAPVSDGINHVQHITPPDFVDGSILPFRHSMHCNTAAARAAAPFLRLTARHPLLKYAAEVRRRHLNCQSGIAPSLNEVVRLAPRVMRIGNAHVGIDAEPHASELAAMT